MRNKDSHDLLNANSYIRNQFDFGGSYTFRNNAMLALSGWIEQVHAKSNGSKKNQLPFGGMFLAYYQLSPSNWIRVNYDCSVDYPDQGLTTSYGYFTDSLTWTGGNPWLKTNITHKISMWIDLWHCFNFQTGYVYAPNAFNAITDLRTENGKSYAATTYQNTLYNEWWASVSLTKRLWKDFLLKADAKYSRIRSSYQQYVNHIQAGFFSTSLNYYSQKWKMNAFMYYRFRRSISVTPQLKAPFNNEETQVGIQKFLCNNHIELMLSYNEIFNIFKNEQKSYSQSPAMRSIWIDPYGERQKHRIMLSFTWNFAGGKSVRKYNKALSTEK